MTDAGWSHASETCPGLTSGCSKPKSQTRDAAVYGTIRSRKFPVRYRFAGDYWGELMLLEVSVLSDILIADFTYPKVMMFNSGYSIHSNLLTYSAFNI